MKDNIQFASFGDRFWASIIDTLLLIAIQIPLFYLFYKEALFEDISVIEDFNTLNILVSYVLPIIIILLFWNYKSATPGKMFLKIKIVDVSTFEKPSKKQFIIRYLGYFVSFIPLCLGYFWMLWDKKNQTWHDKMSNTVLIKPKSKSKKISFGGYISRILVVFIIVISFVLLGLGLKIKYSDLIINFVYPASSVKEDIKEELITKNIIQDKNDLLYFQTNSFFDYTSEGMVITRDAIIRFEEDEKDDFKIEKYFFKDIKYKIDVEKTLGIDVGLLTVYDKEDNYLFLESIDYFDEKEVEKFRSDFKNILTNGSLFYVKDTSLLDKIDVPIQVEEYIELIKKNQTTQNSVYIADMIMIGYQKYFQDRKTFKEYTNEVHKLFSKKSSKNMNNSWINISTLDKLEISDFDSFLEQLENLNTKDKDESNTWNQLTKRLANIYLYWMEKELEAIKNSNTSVSIVELYKKDGKTIKEVDSSRDYLISKVYIEIADFCEDAEYISCSELDYNKKAVQSSKLNPTALFSYAYHILESDENSIKLLEDVLSLIKVSDKLFDREIAALYNNLGYAIYKHDKTEKYADALVYLEKAYSLNNSYVFSLATIAGIYKENNSDKLIYDVLKNDAYKFLHASNAKLRDKDSNYWIFVRKVITSSYEFKDYNSMKYICNKYEEIKEEKYEYCTDNLKKISELKDIKPKYSFWKLYTQPEMHTPINKNNTTEVLEVGAVLPYGKSLRFKSTSQVQSKLLEKFTKLYKPLIVPDTLKKLIEIEEKLGADNYVVSFYLDPVSKEEFFYSTFSYEDEKLNKEVSSHFLPLAHIDGTGGNAAFWLKDGKNTNLEDTPIVAFGSEGAINIVAKNITDFIYMLSFGVEGMDGEYSQYVANSEVHYRRESFMEYRKWLKDTMNIEPVKDWKISGTPQKIEKLQEEAKDLYEIKLYSMLAKYLKDTDIQELLIKKQSIKSLEEKKKKLLQVLSKKQSSKIYLNLVKNGKVLKLLYNYSSDEIDKFYGGAYKLSKGNNNILDQWARFNARIKHSNNIVINEEKAQYNHELFKIYKNLGKEKKAKKSKDTSINVYLEMLENEKNYKAKIRINEDLASIYKDANEVQNSIKIYKNIINLDLPKDQEWRKKYFYDDVAGLYDTLEDYTKAIEYYKKAIDTRDKKIDKAIYYQSIANNYELLEDYTKSLEYSRKVFTSVEVNSVLYEESKKTIAKLKLKVK